MTIEISKIKQEKPIEELLRFGVINIDKPTGPTSFSVSNYIAKQLKLNKASHMGTLDPQVTGVLPVLLGRACRLSEYFMHKNKTYAGIMRIHKEVDDKTLNTAITKFIGKIKQLPPVRSAVKRAVREREILSFDIIERDEKDKKDILFVTEVQAGTYIRKLIDDIGKEIGGAHMLELRRVKAGIFDEKKIYNLYEFDKAIEEFKKGNESSLREMIAPAEIISSFMPSIQLTNKYLIKKLLTGKPILKNEIKLPENVEKFCIFNGSSFIGIYTVVNEGNIVARAEFIFN
jgi:H/ACA ribonucleoprotein complex subunit 4